LITEAFERLEQGERLTTIMNAKLKKELRPIHKVEAEKTRIYEAVNLVYLIVFKMIFGRTIAHLSSNPVNSPICCGINLHGFDATRFFQQFDFSNVVFDGDYKRFDTTIPRDLMKQSIDFVIETSNFSSKTRNIAILLMDDILNAHVQFKKTIFVLDGAMSSGNPITTVLNCINNFTAMLNCIWYICFKHDIDISITDGILIKTYGDDVIAEVGDSRFPQTELPAVMKKLYAMTFTNPDGGDSIERLTPAQTSFLGRHFVPDNIGTTTFYQAPLDKDTIYSIIDYTKAPVHLEHDIMAQQVTAMLIEASHHGQKFYDDLTTKLREHPHCNFDGLVNWKTYHEMMDGRLSGDITQVYEF
jgi:hypothetical protein